MNRPTPIWHRRWPIWLALISGGLPIVATHLSYAINIAFGYVDACLPYWHGCASISRAARSGPGLMIFRALMIPSALGLVALWLLIRDGLLLTGCRLSTGLRWQTGLGVAGALFLIVYVSWLGEQGAVYSWLRSYGVYGYFGFTALAQLLLLGQLRLLDQAGRAETAKQPVRWLMRSIVLLWLSGLLFASRLAFFDDPQLLDRLENAVEWIFALLMNAILLLMGWLLARLKVRLGITVR